MGQKKFVFQADLEEKQVSFVKLADSAVTRAYDEASGIRDPRIWTAERDKEMWESLES